MALENILEAVERQSLAESEKIRAQAEAEAAAVVAQAEGEAESIRRRYRGSAAARLQTERWRLIHRARLAAVRGMAEARETLIAETFAAAEVELPRLREHPEYPDCLKRLAREVAEALGPRLRIVVDVRDEPLMRRIVSEMGIEAEISAGLNVAGGLEASTADGRVTILNTFESRLKLGHRRLRQMIASLLVPENP